MIIAKLEGYSVTFQKLSMKCGMRELFIKLNKRNGISGNLLSLLTDFLRNRKQRVILNGQSSSWANIKAGVPQGSILGPLLFLIYIHE